MLTKVAFCADSIAMEDGWIAQSTLLLIQEYVGEPVYFFSTGKAKPDFQAPVIHYKDDWTNRLRNFETILWSFQDFEVFYMRDAT